MCTRLCMVSDVPVVFIQATQLLHVAISYVFGATGKMGMDWLSKLGSMSGLLSFGFWLAT